ncbi:MAG TPA: peptidoglycan DD-metalloendopeptidase family protein, partial [Nevskiaceae bacterium]|nr:peptidoglycan DD-metalloendopeptidase family protein [Nevskiaceae bacterium]
ADLETQRQKVESARREREAAATRLEAARVRLGRGLRALYMADAPTRLQALFQADRLSAIDRVEADAAAVATSLAKSVAEVRDRIAALQATEDALQAQVDGLEARRQTSSDALTVLRRAQKARKDAMDALAQRIGDRTAERVDVEKEQSRLQKVIENVRRAIREAPDMKYEQGVPFSDQRGKLPWPLRGTLIAEFGQAKAGGGRMKWNGWWIAAEEGTAVRAVADARVVYVGQIQRFGLVVILDHAGDYLSLYGHVQAAQAQVGDMVKAGDPIAAAGSSGGHEESGVYFEIRRGTTAVDPKSWLAQ